MFRLSSLLLIVVLLWFGVANANLITKTSLIKISNSNSITNSKISSETPDASNVGVSRLSVDFSYSISWIDAQPVASGDNQWACLTEALYFEARGEPVRGQFAVAEVILNRVESVRFPDSICDVIDQGTGKLYQCQFTYNCDGFKEVFWDDKAFERVGKVARAMLDTPTHNLTQGATHYHVLGIEPNWSKVYTQTAEIGAHVFYRYNYQTTLRQPPR
ncbi:MAG: cell wall hydrolase [Aestuariivita sp.]|nr:cell wall hydrolase [Aestuariivita sp.]